MITDAQVHIWEPDRPDRPWPRPLRNQPQLPNGFTAAEMIAQMDAEQASLSGVSLDEEMANMIKFETAYQASARYISTINRAPSTTDASPASHTWTVHTTAPETTRTTTDTRGRAVRTGASPPRAVTVRTIQCCTGNVRAAAAKLQ